MQKIILAIYNSNGVKVQTLVNEVKEAGTYKIEFDMDGFENGEYICKLESDNYFETKKMILMK